jgi:hypothetical protein
MKKINIVVMCFFAAVVLASALFAADKPDSLKLAAFRSAADSVPGWTEQKDRFRSFGTKELYELIDGGAVEYIKPGLVCGITMFLSGASNRSAELYIEDFGSKPRARDMVKEKRKKASEPKLLPGSGDKNAFYDGVIGGCVVYFSSGRFYFEMILTGYDKQETAVQDAGIFMGRLMEKNLKVVEKSK